MFCNKYIVIYTLNNLIIGASFELNALYKGRYINGVKYKNANTVMCNCYTRILKISMLKNKTNRSSRFYVVVAKRVYTLTYVTQFLNIRIIVCFIHVLAQSDHTKYTTKHLDIFSFLCVHTGLIFSQRVISCCQNNNVPLFCAYHSERLPNNKHGAYRLFLSVMWASLSCSHQTHTFRWNSWRGSKVTLSYWVWC